jgi:2'-5' RNA ligase
MWAFVAIRLPQSVKDSLAQLQCTLDQAQADVTWVEPHNLHVTLKFLDEISESQAQHVMSLLARVASAEPGFELGLAQPGAFPSVAAPRVMWVGLAQGQQTAARIAAAIEMGSRELGLRTEERPFAAHVTLGRVRSARGRPRLADQIRSVRWIPPAGWQVRALTLYESRLSSAGPQYVVREEAGLSVAARSGLGDLA